MQTEKEQLYTLLTELKSNKIDINQFTNKFLKIFDLEIDYDELTQEEYRLMGEVSDMSARFSDSSEDLKLPNVYYSEDQIRAEVDKVLKVLIWNGTKQKLLPRKKVKYCKLPTSLLLVGFSMD